MPHYKTRTYSDSSIYETDEEITYFPTKPLGQGNYAKARLFKSCSEETVVVLNSVKLPADIEEAKIKHRFFQKLYPDQQSDLFIIGKDYRLIIPYIPHIPYQDLLINTPESQKIIFRSAIEALQDCHAKGMIVIDLKSDSIYYDISTQKSYLIDGGLSAPRGTVVDPLTFQKPNQKIIEDCRQEYGHIPPECWSIAPLSTYASPAMDVYSLGVLMQDLLLHPNEEIKLLTSRCLEKIPENRPTLEDLIHFLEPPTLMTGSGPN